MVYNLHFIYYRGHINYQRFIDDRGVFAFISYSGYVTGPISSMLNLRMMISIILPSAKRLFSFYDLDEEDDNQEKLNPNTPQQIEFINVSFSYNDQPVLNNINLDGEISAELFDMACQRSGASTFINRLNEKENSLIGANGAKLSGGEKQKLAVARAILKDAPFVIFDEATSSYDVESDSFLHEFIQSGLKDKTVIVITHKYNHLRGMNQI